MAVRTCLWAILVCIGVGLFSVAQPVLNAEPQGGTCCMRGTGQGGCSGDDLCCKPESLGALPCEPGDKKGYCRPWCKGESDAE